MRLLFSFLTGMILAIVAAPSAHADEYFPYIQITCIPELSFFSAKFLYLHSENDALIHPRSGNRATQSSSRLNSTSVVADKKDITWSGTPGPGFSYTCKLAHLYPDESHKSDPGLFKATNGDNDGIAEVTLSFDEIGDILKMAEIVNTCSPYRVDRRIKLSFNKQQLMSIYKSFECNYRGIPGDFDDFEINYRGYGYGMVNICDNSTYMGRPCLIKRIEDLLKTPMNDVVYKKEIEHLKRYGVEQFPYRQEEYDRIRKAVFGNDDKNSGDK